MIKDNYPVTKNVYVLGHKGRLGSLIVDELKQHNNVQHNNVNLCFKHGFDKNFETTNEFLNIIPSNSVIIDVSHPDATKTLLENLLLNKIYCPLVIGTTGNLPMELITEYSKYAPVGVSSNFSQGINQFKNMIRSISDKSAWKVSMTETHHTRKKDSPSGTAKMIANAINKELDDSMEFNYGRSGNDAKRKEKEIGIHAIRGGTIPGEHTVIFAGLDEIVEIKHTALSKKVFAQGSIKAAQYILNKENGLYDMNNLINNN